MRNFMTLASAMGLAALGSVAMAEGWALDTDASHIAFGSVKNNNNAEVHRFQEFSGTVSEAGAVSIEIDLTSVETNIDIRNERMIEHVFKTAATATIKAEIDMAEISGLAVGETTVVEAYGTLSLVGTALDLDAEMFVVRLSESRVIVSSNDMIMLSTEDAGIDGGIDVLKGLAELSGITRVAPVTLRLMFDSDA